MTNRPHEQDFTVDNYEGFYEHHFFVPVPEADALDAHRTIARVGWALDIAKEIQPKNILDLGCLDGSNLLTLVSHLNEDGVTTTGVGVDLSHEGIEVAKDRAEKFEVNASFHEGSIEDWLAGSESDAFGLVCLFEVIEHVKDPDAIVKEIHRVLAPGGTLLVSTPDFEAPDFGMDDEKNKCHIRLYTTRKKNWSATNKYGHEREATSMTAQLKGFKTVSMDVFAQLIHARVTKP